MIEHSVKSFFNLASRFCSFVEKVVAIKKTVAGFIFEAEMGGRCKESVFTITGPPSEGKYSGTFAGAAGTTNLDMKLVVR